MPVIIWFAALVGAGYLFVDQSETVRLKGIVCCDEQIINSVETGYISSLPVKLFQQINEGDTIAVIKENTSAKDSYVNATLLARKATEEAELERLRSELIAAQQNLIQEESDLISDHKSMERRLAIDLENARLQILEIKLGLEPDKLALKDIEVEIEIVNKLLKEDAAEEYELQRIEAQHKILASKVAQQEKLLASAKDNYEYAQIRKDEFEHKYPLRPKLSEVELAPIRNAIIVQERKIAELMKQQDVIVLTAPFNGIITCLDYKAGQTVVRGDPIMKIVKPTPTSITAWLPESQMKLLDERSKVEVVSLDKPHLKFESHISNVSIAIEEIPQRLWDDPAIPKWGRAIQIPVQPGFMSLHNEIVGIRLVN